MDMQNCVIALYIFFWGGVSEVIWQKIYKGKKRDGKKYLQIVRTEIFFTSTILALISGMKWYLGSGESTLFQSFWDIEARTYVHYGIPLFFVSVAQPIMMNTLFHKHAQDWMEHFDVGFFMLCLCTILLKGTICNRDYVIVVGVCLILSFLETMYHNKSYKYLTKNDLKWALRSTLPIVMAWIITLGIYLPNELYLNNYDEFPGSFISFTLIMLLGSIAIAFLFIALEWTLLPIRLIKLMNLALGALICMGYIQIMLLNGNLHALDGTGQVWSGSTTIVNSLIWLVAIVIVTEAGYHKEIVEKICKGACIYIALIQMITLCVLLVTTDYSQNRQREAMTTEHSLELAQKNNVLVFVLDCFEGDWFEEIVADNPDFIEPLSDFTYYRNGTSQFAHTSMAIPYMLTGVTWKNDLEEDYKSYAYRNSSALYELAESGCDVGVYTNVSYLSDDAKLLTSNYRTGVKRKYDISTTLKLMWKASMYKAMPFGLKVKYEYYSGDMSSMVLSENVWNIDNDIPFYNTIEQTGLSVSKNYDKAFRFYHMRGPHGPFYLSDDIKYEPTGREVTVQSQGRGSLKIVYEYLQQLKNIGLYDDATIIITADHGQGYILDSDKISGKPDRTSRPIFLIKKPQEKGTGMNINSATVSQAELLPTIMSALGLEGEKYGRSFDQIGEDERRERTYLDIYDYFNVQYTINGDAAKIDSWSITKAQYDR